jgi:hypothetical protein
VSHVPYVGKYNLVSPQKVLTTQQSSDKRLSPIRNISSALDLLSDDSRPRKTAQHCLLARILHLGSSSWHADWMLTSQQSNGKQADHLTCSLAILPIKNMETTSIIMIGAMLSVSTQQLYSSLQKPISGISPVSNRLYFARQVYVYKDCLSTSR